MENILETANRKTYITIEPHFDPKIFNMGLEKYGQVIFDGTSQIEDLGYREIAGTIRYITGLDEFAPEVKALHEPEKSAKIKQIRETVARLELELGQNVLDIADPDFWRKCQYMNPTNKEFWSKITLKVNSNAVALDPTDPKDVIRIYAIEAGGFTLVAPSLEHAKKSNRRINFYLSRLEDTSAIRTELKKMRNRAKGELDKLRNSKQNKLFLVAKIYLSEQNNFTKSTPSDVLYEKIDDKIEGIGLDTKKKDVVADFLDMVQLDAQTLHLKALTKDAIFFRIMQMRSDKFFYTPLGNICGKNIAECVEFYKNPMNEADMKELIERVEKRWNS